MFDNLNQPYPFNNNFKHNLRTIAFVCMSFMLIMLYFQPFGINFLASPKDGYFVLAMGLLSAANFFFNTLILPGLFPKLFESHRWTIKKELIWNFGMFVLLIVAFTLTAMFFRITGMQTLTVFRSGAIALLPLVLFNLLNYNNSLKSKVNQVIDSGRHWLAEERKGMHSDTKGMHSDTKDLHNETNDQVRIVSDNGKEVFEAELKNIIAIQSASNYIEIFYREGTMVRKQMLRQTLSKVELVLSAFRNIQRCHRCCLVNIDQVSKLSGNAPNYTLEASGLEIRIPVSRQNVSKFRKLLSER
ncbi:MAG TPA: LytTR family DNA-binding domain-containing protein [Bacteroidales bacterium]|nr:LytTR family DNA-binding domain-containing protein [Bacteroidales bacterium]